MIARICTRTGWLPDAVRDGLTLEDCGYLFDEWQEHPPLQVMVQAYIGIESKKRPARIAPTVVQPPVDSLPVQAPVPQFVLPTPSSRNAESFGELLNIFGDGVIRDGV